MQMRWYFAYDYDFQKWEVQYYYRPEFGGHIQTFYFHVNFKLSIYISCMYIYAAV